MCGNTFDLKSLAAERFKKSWDKNFPILRLKRQSVSSEETQSMGRDLNNGGTYLNPMLRALVSQPTWLPSQSWCCRARAGGRGVWCPGQQSHNFGKALGSLAHTALWMNSTLCSPNCAATGCWKCGHGGITVKKHNRSWSGKQGFSPLIDFYFILFFIFCKGKTISSFEWTLKYNHLQ